MATAVSDELRRKRIEKDNHECSNCGSPGVLHVHHIVPQSSGGKNKLTNLRTLCSECHSKAHHNKIGIVDVSDRSPSASDSRWLPAVSDVRWLVRQTRHPLNRLALMLIAKTGMAPSEAVEIKLGDIFLNGGGFGLVERLPLRESSFLLIRKNRTVTPSGARLCDTMVPIDSELKECLKKFLAVRPDADTDRLLVTTSNSWGEQLEPDQVHTIAKTAASRAGLRKADGDQKTSLTPTTLRLFFKDKFRGRPEVQDYIIGKKEQAPVNRGLIMTDYREGIYNLTG